MDPTKGIGKYASGKKPQLNNPNHNSGKGKFNPLPKEPTSHEGVNLLQFIQGRPSPNFLSWEKAISLKLQVDYGSLGDFIDNGYHLRSPLADYDALYKADKDRSEAEAQKSATYLANLVLRGETDKAAAKQAKALAAAKALEDEQAKADASEVHKETVRLRLKAKDAGIVKMLDVEPKMIAFILCCCSKESRQALEAHEDFSDIRKDHNIIELMNLIKTLHFLGDGRNPANQGREARMALDECKQSDKEDLGAFKQRFLYTCLN